jgi:hypothetical protein
VAVANDSDRLVAPARPPRDRSTWGDDEIDSVAERVVAWWARSAPTVSGPDAPTPCPACGADPDQSTDRFPALTGDGLRVRSDLTLNGVNTGKGVPVPRDRRRQPVAHPRPHWWPAQRSAAHCRRWLRPVDDNHWMRQPVRCPRRQPRTEPRLAHLRRRPGATDDRRPTRAELRRHPPQRSGCLDRLGQNACAERQVAAPRRPGTTVSPGRLGPGGWAGAYVGSGPGRRAGGGIGMTGSARRISNCAR